MVIALIFLVSVTSMAISYLCGRHKNDTVIPQISQHDIESHTDKSSQISNEMNFTIKEKSTNDLF